MLEILLLLTTASFYISISVTEGWKWRMSKGREDNHPWVTYRTYHVWRGVTNISFILATVAFLVPYGIGLTPRAFLFLFLANVGSWMAYERCMSYVQDDSFLVKREDFHVLGRTFPRPAPIVEVALCLTSYAAAVAVWLLG